MYEALLAQIDRAIEEAKSSLTQDLAGLIELKSIYEDTPRPGAPFGDGPLRVLDAMKKMGEKEGFYTQDYHVGVVSLALKNGSPDLGIWCHGAGNSQGPLCAIFHLLKIFKERGVPLNDNPALSVGSDQQNGMSDMVGISGSADVRGFCNVCTPPRLSLVPDGVFPVGYGGKGAMVIKFRGNKPLRDLTIAAGQAGSRGTAEAILHGETIRCCSPVRHPSNPEPYGNMIAQLMEALLSRQETALENRLMLEFFKLVSKDIYGKRLCVDAENGEMGPLTICAKEINTVAGYPDLTVQIHYPLGITYGEIARMMTDAAEKYDVAVVDAHNIAKPYVLNKEQKIIRRLTALANEVTWEEKEPYILSKDTYANLIPNALVYGMDRETERSVDEAISIERLLKGMKVYARALLTLNDMDWNRM